MEKRRQEVKNISEKIFNDYHKVSDNIDMWLVFVITKDVIANVFNVSTAYFHERGDAEIWFSLKTSNNKPYYGFCCDNFIYNNVDELLKEN